MSVEVQDESQQAEAEYALESPIKCPACRDFFDTVRVVRLLRTKVNFTSALPRRGYIVTCPGCQTALPAVIGSSLSNLIPG